MLGTQAPRVSFVRRPKAFPHPSSLISTQYDARVRILAAIQAVYFLLTGVWPLVHIRSFMTVTGPKQDLWLVRTVGVLVTCIGIDIGLAAIRSAVDANVITLAITSAIGLTAIDVIYVARGTIWKVYLVDAAAEILLVTAWIVLIFAV
jgi:hypothetical protein